jgi:hypothetical protein
MRQANHTATTSEWYTPLWLAQKARNVLGDIGTDPASCRLAQQTVRADRWLGPDKTLQDAGWDSYNDWAGSDGLCVSRWSGSVFLNPPSGLVRKFWDAAYEYYLTTGNPVFWVGFNINQLCTLQDSPSGGPLYRPTILLRNRVAFTGRSNSPAHHNYVTLISRSSPIQEDFVKEFSGLGYTIGGFRI